MVTVKEGAIGKERMRNLNSRHNFRRPDGMIRVMWEEAKKIFKIKEYYLTLNDLK